MELSGRSVVLTGVGREGQVGEAVARAFAERGARVFLVDRMEDEARARSDALLAAGLRSASLAADLTRRRRRRRRSPRACARRRAAACTRWCTSPAASPRAARWPTAIPPRGPASSRSTSRRRTSPRARSCRSCAPRRARWSSSAPRRRCPGARVAGIARVRGGQERGARPHAGHRAGGAGQRRARQRASRPPPSAPPPTSPRWARTRRTSRARPWPTWWSGCAPMPLAPSPGRSSACGDPRACRLAAHGSALQLARMTVAARRRAVSRAVRLDRSLEALPLFRLSDSADDGVITYSDGSGGRWRVIPSPGDRLPGTFDQDVYVELLRRFQEAGEPADGAITFTLHAFLRAMGRRVDGRTYEQLRGALGRLERTTLESTGIYESASRRTAAISASRCSAPSRSSGGAASIASSSQLFSTITTGEPGVARVVLAAVDAREPRRQSHDQHLRSRATGPSALPSPGASTGCSRSRAPTGGSPGASPWTSSPSSSRSPSATRRISSACSSRPTTCSWRRVCFAMRPFGNTSATGSSITCSGLAPA